MVSTTLSNPNIHWEEVRQTNFGVDMSLFNSRVNLSLDAYIKKTAYEIMSGDWSSDVCSSDLVGWRGGLLPPSFGKVRRSYIHRIH